MTYDESVHRIGANIGTETDAAPYGHTLFLTHGHKTDRTVVMYHGYTNCPRQYEMLAQRFFDRGYNVYVPRVPHHGLADLCTREISKLSLEEIVEICTSSVAIASGLGDQVTVLGLSMGGVMAAWNAQFSDEVDTSVVLVPSFAWYFLPGVIRPLVHLSSWLPNRFMWWDPIQKTRRVKPYSMYHHFATRGMGDIMRMGAAVLRAAAQDPPRARRIIVMTNERDIAVDERATRALISRWQRRGAVVDYYRFPKELLMEHDIIDPLHPYAKPDIVYGKIFEYLERPMP